MTDINEIIEKVKLIKDNAIQEKGFDKLNSFGGIALFKNFKNTELVTQATADLKDEEKAELFFHQYANGITFFHQAFGSKDSAVIKYYVDSVTAKQLEEGLKKLSASMKTAVDNNASKLNVLEAIFNANIAEEKKRVILKSIGFEDKNLLHRIATKKTLGENDETLKYILGKAKDLSVLGDMLTSKNKVGDSAIHMVFKNSEKDSIKNFLTTVLNEEGIDLEKVFKDQGQNKVSLLHLACDAEKSNDDILTLVLKKLDSLDEKKIKEILALKTSNQKTAIKMFFENENFIASFGNLTKKTVFAGPIIDDMDKLKKVTGVKDKLSAVYEGIKEDEATKTSFLEKVVLTEDNIGNVFDDEIIQDKIDAQVEILKNSINDATDAASLVTALSDANTELATYKLPNSLSEAKTGAETQLNTAVQGKAKALLIAETVGCKETWGNTDTTDAAQQCLEEIKGYIGDSADETLKGAIGDSLNELKKAANDFKEANSISTDDLKKGTNDFFHYVKHKFATNLVSHWKEQKSIDESSYNKVTAHAGLLSDLETDGAIPESVKIGSTENEVAEIFSDNSAFASEPDDFTGAMKEYEFDSLNQTIGLFQKATCDAFKLDEGKTKECSDANIFAVIKESFCLLQNEEGTHPNAETKAYKVFCDSVIVTEDVLETGMYLQDYFNLEVQNTDF